MGNTIVRLQEDRRRQPVILLNPKNYNRQHTDPKTREVMLRTINFFESKGLKKIKEDDQAMTWYDDFLNFIKKEQTFATLLTPSGYGDADSRWDMWRIEEYNEILGFYGISYWYAWQVSILGLGPIWMGTNEEVKHKAAKLLKEGNIFAFGLSEKEHGADLYASDMKLHPQKDGTYLANGSKYYIGNGNVAPMLSTFGRFADTGDYVFFVVNSQHPSYKHSRIKTSGCRQGYVAEYTLTDYPITEADIISRGQLAWDSSLNTVNVGKYELGWCSVGICTHALYEAINHASHRNLYGQYVTDFPHVKKMFTEAYTRLVAMKLFALRAADYMKSASDEDRRYLLYNPVVKMKVTSQGEKVIQLLHDIVAAKGFEQDTYFEMAIRDIGMLPKLEGTTHVNMALIIKFITNYFLNTVDYPDIPRRNDPSNDAYLFKQRAGGLGKVTFPNYGKVYADFNIPNVNLFREQLELFKEMLLTAPPTKEQSGNVDYMLAVGELFTLIVYAQLILENVNIYRIDHDIVNEIFSFIVRDYSQYALVVYSNYENTKPQEAILTKMLRKPILDQGKFDRVWTDFVYALKDTYVMNK
ncbi:MAG: acyl-CoA dehydrogenase [Chloroflexi bacterium]|nr:acyl-CoA dehydrogenase [Chloroflexota bacterium]